MKNNSAILFDTLSGQWLHFKEPVAVLIANSLKEVLPVLHEADNAVTRNGFHATGFISYEAAPAFDQALVTHVSGKCPLVWFGLYDTAHTSSPEAPPHSLESYFTERKGAFSPNTFRAKISPGEYKNAFCAIKDHIRNGDTYQVNYTFRMMAKACCGFEALFLSLAQAGHGQYACLIETDDFTIYSLSPELFFKLHGDHIYCRPMKGTIHRGRCLKEDQELVFHLQHSAKDRAENIMITDMIRNDLGRVCKPGSVLVDELCAIEKYETVFQMVSRVSGSTAATVPDIFKALFPCASVTGAPKASTMGIIAGLEPDPRNVYTGAIGYWAPGRRAQFNVAIRTILFDKKTGIAEYGTGGGIVWDSEPEKEFQEALAKTRVLFAAVQDFSLLETMLWTREKGFFLFEHHCKRLLASAGYFGFAIEEERVIEYLKHVSSQINGGQCRIRFLASRTGEMRHEIFSLDGAAESILVRLRMAKTAVHSNDRFLFHKTDNRDFYNRAREACPDCDDVVLFNEQNQVTETTIANLVVRIDGLLCTPPVSCGLLPGVFRQYLLENGDIVERAITIQECFLAQEIFRINSVRKWERCVLLPEAS